MISKSASKLVWIALVATLSTFAIAGEIAPHRTYGLGHPFAMADLPDSPFRRQIEALPPAAKALTLAKLAGITFHSHDIDSMNADGLGGVYFVCSISPEKKAFMKALAAAAEPNAARSVAQAPVPIANPPLYHSNPGATRVIYLDFNGMVITGTNWNSSSGVSSWTAVPFDTDGDPTTFSDSEQTAIRRVWERVAEDYAPFNVDVTTEQPATFTSTTGRVLITRNTDSANVNMPASTAGGVAYVNVFGQSNYVSTYSPAFVYYNNLGSREDYIAEACSHEMGHNLGLAHDATNAAPGYYPGHGSGNISWSTIMGVGYDCNVTQWSKGDYYDANNTQDDLAIITGKLPYRADDHGDTFVTATALTVTNGTTISSTAATNHGIIERSTDVDVFTFSNGGGAINLTINPWRSGAHTLGGNLDILAELYDAGGTLVASSNPAADTAASISYSGGMGTYYLMVKPVGTGTPLVNPPSGYTNYASLGQYFIDGTLAPPTLPDLIVQSITSAPTNPAPGQTVTFTVSIKNQSSASAVGTFNVGFWSNLPAAPTITTVPEANKDVVGGLAGNTAAVLVFTTVATSGSFKAWAYVDRLNGASQIAELNETNNAGPLAGVPWGTSGPPLVIAPVISSALKATTNINAPFTYTITATNTPTSFSATGLPQGLSINTTTGVISGTPTIGGDFSIPIGAANSAGTDSATLVLSVIQPPFFVSSPTATPNPAIPGQFVNFIAVTGGSGTVAVHWEFGDGTDMWGDNVNHAFSNPGTYTVKVTADSGLGTPASTTLSVVIKASGTGGDGGSGGGNGGGTLLPGEKDSDGDGFSDVVEVAAGTNPNNAKDSPSGGAAPVLSDIINMFMKTAGKKATLTVTGAIHIPNRFEASNKVVLSDINGSVTKFQLDRSGSGKSAQGSFKLTVKSKRGIAPEQDAKFKLVITTTPGNITMSTPINIIVGGTIYTNQ